MHHPQQTTNQAASTKRFKPCIFAAVASLVLLPGLNSEASAVELSHSFFGTLQYTQSTDEFAYSRFIDDDGTFRHNSLLGYQLDARVSPNLVGTVQLIGTNKLDSDSGQEVRFRQGFIGYEKGDWTLRVGRQRVPLYLNSRNFDVQHTYTVTNLPPEVYLSSTADSYDGVSVTKNISNLLPESHSNGYAQVSFYAGPIDYELRSAGVNQETRFFPIMADIAGATLSASGDDWATNLSFVRLNGKITGSFQFGPLGDLPFVSNLDIDFISAGFKKSITDRASVAVEYLHESNKSITERTLPIIGVRRTESAVDGESVSIIGEYLVNRSITGYVGYYAQNAERVSQYSLAVGARYDLDLNRSLKAEILGVKANQPSSAFDGPSASRDFNVFSLSYNWAY